MARTDSVASAGFHYAYICNVKVLWTVLLETSRLRDFESVTVHLSVQLSGKYSSSHGSDFAETSGNDAPFNNSENGTNKFVVNLYSKKQAYKVLYRYDKT